MRKLLDGMQSWVYRVVCAAMLTAAAGSLMPAGPVRRLGQLTGSLVLLLALLSPLVSVDGEALARAMSEYHFPQSRAEELEEADEALFRTLIEEESGAYISEQAAELGAVCTVVVETRPQEDGYPVPWAVTVTGALDGETQAQLTRRIEAELAIPASRQTYRTEEGT